MAVGFHLSNWTFLDLSTSVSKTVYCVDATFGQGGHSNAILGILVITKRDKESKQSQNMTHTQTQREREREEWQRNWGKAAESWSNIPGIAFLGVSEIFFLLRFYEENAPSNTELIAIDRDALMFQKEQARAVQQKWGAKLRTVVGAFGDLFSIVKQCIGCVFLYSQHAHGRSGFTPLYFSMLWVHASSARSSYIFTHVIPTCISLCLCSC